MESLFVDTTFLVAVYNLEDKHHDRAEAFLQELADGRHGNFRLFTTDYVFDEMVTAILTRTRKHAVAAAAGRAIRDSEAWRVEILGEAGFEEAWTLFLERKDKRWSFTDCTSFRFMEQRGLRKALSFDVNFTQAGFVTLP